jgi:hypothetical protein
MRWPRLKVRHDPDQLPEKRRYTTDDYAQWLSQAWGLGSFAFQGSQYPLGLQMTQPGAKTEPIGENFVGYVGHGLKGNGIVWTCESIRLEVFSQARFKWRRFNKGKPGDLFGDQGLRTLEDPNLLPQAILDVDLAGNFYAALVEGQLIRLRPDWVDVVLDPIRVRGGILGYKKLGYFYYPDGHRDSRPLSFDVNEVAHFTVKPDPVATYRGMSWLQPVVREFMGDTAYTRHKLAFVDNAATPNLAIAFAKEMSQAQFEAFIDKMDATHSGPQQAGKTLYLGPGADVTVVGADMRQLDFKVVQGAGESRVAAAAGVGAVIAQFSEGMQGSSLNAGNFTAARRRFADITMRYLWQRACESFTTVVSPPEGSELWYDAADIPFLQEDALDAAEILSRMMLTIESGVRAGFEPDTIRNAVVAGDLSLLQHTGLFSVQLQPPGTVAAPRQPELAATNGNGEG